jgi:hypothetical protein
MRESRRLSLLTEQDKMAKLRGALVRGRLSESELAGSKGLGEGSGASSQALSFSYCFVKWLHLQSNRCGIAGGVAIWPGG